MLMWYCSWGITLVSDFNSLSYGLIFTLVCWNIAMKNGLKIFQAYRECWLEKHWFNWAGLCSEIIKLEYIPEVHSFNPWRFCPSARHSYRAGQFEKLDCKSEWRMLSHLAGSVERALPHARCSRTCRKKHFWRRNKHSVCNSELKKEFVYWEQEDASNIKIKSLSGFNWLFFLCFSKWSWILFVHFLWVPYAQKSLYRGSCGTESLSDPLWEFLSGWE